jgi:hypothetical protein
VRKGKTTTGDSVSTRRGTGQVEMGQRQERELGRRIGEKEKKASQGRRKRPRETRVGFY